MRFRRSNSETHHPAGGSLVSSCRAIRRFKKSLLQEFRIADGKFSSQANFAQPPNLLLSKHGHGEMRQEKTPVFLLLLPIAKNMNRKFERVLITAQIVIVKADLDLTFAIGFIH